MPCTQIPCSTEQGFKFTGIRILIAANSESMQWERRIGSPESEVPLDLQALPRRLQERLFPRGLLARATFRRSIGDRDGTARDLGEVEEIAEPGPMRLHLCDTALERARLGADAHRGVRAAQSSTIVRRSRSRRLPPRRRA
jgi:hypothetical protein